MEYVIGPLIGGLIVFVVAFIAISAGRGVDQKRSSGKQTVPARMTSRPESPDQVLPQLLAAGWQIRSPMAATGQSTIELNDVTISIAPNNGGGSSLAYLGQRVPAAQAQRVEATVSSVLGPAPG